MIVQPRAWGLFEWLRCLSTGAPPCLKALLCLVALASWGCQASPNGASDDVLPDDDDTPVVEDDDDPSDDDDSGAGDDDTADDEPPLGDDDTAAGDDDTSDQEDDSALLACEPQALIDPSCVDAAYEELQLAVGLQSCPDGDYVFSSQSEWQDFYLNDCGLTFDPFAAHDWSTRTLVAILRNATGCNPVGEVLWFVQCVDGFHLGNAFLACGDCDTELFVSRFVSVSSAFVPVTVEACVPEKMSCD
ncbi:MAG: hypothetical protein CL928_06200 [Deltaproteobacteria bacterium]|nr:hypothetical protein [Deltaproteobacteria bacterium]